MTKNNPDIIDLCNWLEASMKNTYPDTTACRCHMNAIDAAQVYLNKRGKA